MRWTARRRVVAFAVALAMALALLAWLLRLGGEGTLEQRAREKAAEMLERARRQTR